jgi:ankyrin repeat protein
MMTTNMCADTPLHEATQAGMAEAVRILVERCPGAAWMRNGRWDTPLHLAARAGNIDVVRLLVKYWPEGTRGKDQ